MQNTDPSKTIVTHDSGSPRDQVMPFYNTVNPNGFIAWGKSTQLGYSLGLAMGAAMAEREELRLDPYCFVQPDFVHIRNSARRKARSEPRWPR